MKSIRVVHVINDLNVGGAEMMLYKLLSEMKRDRFNPTVVSLRNHGQMHRQFEEIQVPVRSVAMKLPAPTPTSSWRLIHLMRSLDPDLIQGWMYHGNLAAQFSAAFLRKPVPVIWNIRQTLYGLDYEKPLTAGIIKFSARLSRRPTRIIYNSRIAAAQHEAIGYARQDSVVIPNGFMTRLFTPSPEARVSVRSELGIPQRTVLIGLFGRYHPVKDHSNFLRAAASLLKHHPDVQFLLCGRRINWLNATLCRMIEELKLSERIHLLDQRQDMPRITAALDVAVSSSCAESFPNVIGEAMSSGVPCVVTDVSDLSLIVGDTGRVVPPRNSEALAAAIHELVEAGSDGRKALGDAARERVIQHFPLDEIDSRYEQVYEDAYSKHGHGMASRNHTPEFNDQQSPYSDPSITISDSL